MTPPYSAYRLVDIMVDIIMPVPINNMGLLFRFYVVCR